MTIEERSINTVILIAVAKMLSEQSTTLTGELKQKKKQIFNQMVMECDRFVLEVEKMLTEEEIQMIQNITDRFHTSLQEIRNK